MSSFHRTLSCLGMLMGMQSPSYHHDLTAMSLCQYTAESIQRGGKGLGSYCLSL